MLTGGNVADCTAAEALLENLPETGLVNADKGYDSNAIRRQISERGAFANIPPKANRLWKNCFSPFLYRDRNAIERMFCRIKDFRPSQPDTIETQQTSSPPFRSLPPSHSGYESGP